VRGESATVSATAPSGISSASAALGIGGSLSTTGLSVSMSATLGHGCAVAFLGSAPPALGSTAAGQGEGVSMAAVAPTARGALVEVTMQGSVSGSAGGYGPPSVGGWLQKGTPDCILVAQAAVSLPPSSCSASVTTPVAEAHIQVTRTSVAEAQLAAYNLKVAQAEQARLKRLHAAQP
jgi:hypothetical protein